MSSHDSDGDACGPIEDPLEHSLRLEHSLAEITASP